MTPIELPTLHINGFTIRGTSERPLEVVLREIVTHMELHEAQPENGAKAGATTSAPTRLKRQRVSTKEQATP